MINQKTKIILGFTFIFLLLSVVGLWWMSTQVSSVGKTLKSEVKVVADRLAQEQKYAELVDLVNETETVRNELETYILTEEETIDFLAQIEQIGIDQGVDLETLSLNVVEKSGMFDELVVNFSVSGNELLVLKMIDVLESLPYHSQIESLDIERRTELNEALMRVRLSVSLIKT